MTESNRKARVDEDDDLDDLDDILDQFSPAQPTSPPKPPPAGASTSTQPEPEGENVLMEDFAEKLASLFKDMGIEPDTGSEQPEGTADRERLAAAWEAMFIEEMNAMSNPSGARAATDASSPKPKADDFQSRIQSTMNKRKERESDLKSTDTDVGGGSDSFESLLSQLQGLNGPSTDGSESEEQIEGVLEAMMGQLMSKDVLYEPLKELHEKFPEYLDKNASTLSAEDKQRFDAQISCIRRLLDEFEAKTYRDDDEEGRKRIVELMSELQTHGSPPEEIMGPLPPGFTMGADGLPDFPEGCSII